MIGLVVLASTAASTLGARPARRLQRPVRPRLRRPARRGRHRGGQHRPGLVRPAGRHHPAARGYRGGRPFAETTVACSSELPGGPGQPAGRGAVPAEPGRPRLARRPGRRPHADLGPLGHGSRGRSCSSATGSARRCMLGTQVTVTGVPGSPDAHRGRLRHLGHHDRPGLGAARRDGGAARAGAPDVAQMLYRFSSAGTNAQVNADIAAVRAALPPGSLLSAQSYLTVKLQATELDRAVGAVHRGVRRDRAGDVGADRGQRGQRRGGGGHPPDRRAEVHRVLARAGGRGSY